MNEFEKYEAKRGRRLAYRILFQVVLNLFSLYFMVRHFSNGEIGWGIFWAVITVVGVLSDYMVTRTKLIEYFRVHRPVTD